MKIRSTKAYTALLNIKTNKFIEKTCKTELAEKKSFSIFL